MLTSSRTPCGATGPPQSHMLATGSRIHIVVPPPALRRLQLRAWPLRGESSYFDCFFPLFRVVEHGMATGILSARQGSRPRDPIVKSTKLWVCDGARWGTAIRTCTAQGGGRAKGSLPGNLIGCPPRHPRGTSAPGLFGARRQNTLRCARLHVSVHLDLETNGWLPLVGERGEAVSEAYFWSTNGARRLGRPRLGVADRSASLESNKSNRDCAQYGIQLGRQLLVDVMEDRFPSRPALHNVTPGRLAGCTAAAGFGGGSSD